jgi:uncharacterized protein YjiS (DUF1127 family)
MSMSSFEFLAPEFQTPEFRASKGASPAGSRGAAMLRPLLHAFAWFRHRRQARRDLDRLMRFSDRELADIGVGRTELLHVARYGQLPEQGSAPRFR